MPKILIVDDQLSLAEEMSFYLKENGYECAFCESATSARELYQQNKYDLVVCDVQMPDEDGTNFFLSMKDEFKINKTSFILMTGNTHLMNLQRAYDLGVCEFVSKPFDIIDFKLVVDLVLRQADPNQFHRTKFYKISLMDYLASAANNFDIFILVNNNYMCLAKKGQELSKARLINYMKKGLSEIFLTASDFAKYTDTPCASLVEPFEKPVEQLKKKKLQAQLLKSLTASHFSQMIESDLYKRSLLNFEIYSQTVFENDELFKLMNDYFQTHPRALELAAQLSFLVNVMANHWKWTHPKILSKITIGSLVCLTGLTGHADILTKKRSEFTSDDLKDYQSYPFRSHQMLAPIKKIPDEVLQIAIQHLENDIGQGHPQKLTKDKLHPYSRVIHGLRVFLESIDSQSAKDDVKNSLEKVYALHKKSVSEQLLKSLFIIFNVAPPKELSAVLLPHQTARLI